MRTQGPATNPTPPHVQPPAPATAAAPAPDPIPVLLAASEQHFQAGQRELDLGHFDGARLEFNRAVDVLIESPYGGRTEPRVRDHFDHLVDRISALEIRALAVGDGFTEQRSDPASPASIDELLALSVTFEQAPPTPELEQTVKSDLETPGHDVPVPYNDRVLFYIELFQGRLHDFIQEGLTRGGHYLPMIQQVFRAEGLPLDLAYVPLVESAFKVNALSRAKAKGVWQFMSGTAAENGLRHDWYIDERSDPEKATFAAARYLKSLGRLFDGDWYLALASYNGGPGRVQKAIRRVGQSDFWALRAKPRVLPRETREYVPMILAAIVIARNPAQYGFEFSRHIEPVYERVTLDQPVDLRLVAEWADTTIDELRALNPELRRWTTPVRDDQYEIKVPVGMADRVRSRLIESASTDLASLNWYTVKRGDTLPLIARRLGINRADLAEANYLKRNAIVKAGQRLIVPREATALMAARTVRTQPAADARATAAVEPVVLRRGATSGLTKVTYRVRRGDTLTSIARLFSTSVSALRTWNRSLGTRLMPGDRLTVYTSRQAD